MAKKREIEVSKHETIMFLNDALSDKILNIMFIAKDSERKDYRVGYNEISLMNLMFIFLNKYKGNNITKDFYTQQEAIINSIYVSDSEIFNAEYKLKYFINNNIFISLCFYVIFNFK